MESFVLQLKTDQQDPLELSFHNCKSFCSYSELFGGNSLYVFCDAKYSAKVLSPEKLHNITLLLNGNEVQSDFNYNSQMITFRDESFGERIFQECFGYVQLVAIYEDDNGQHKVESNYIQVMVKKGNQNDSICRMVDFVYKSNPNLLYGKPVSKNSADLKNLADKTIESHVKLLADILKIYENNFCYFKANSRFKTVPHEIVDDFEKLQVVSRNTLQYIATHPDQLRQTNVPVAMKIGTSRYLPLKTLIVDSKKTYDIYENQIVISFLKLLRTETISIKHELETIERNIPHKRIETKDYVLSTIFVYKNVASVVKVVIEKIDALYQKINDLYNVYLKILPVSERIISGIPFMSHIFKSIPQYHQIYNCIEAWFLKGVFSLDREKFILSFVKMSQLYEVYVLSKFLVFLENTGFSLESSEKILYPKPPKSLYENTSCNNCFKYQKNGGSTRITLYYQPVIYKNDMQHIAGIGLYRNTSISFPKSSDFYGMVSNPGTYYTPDYIIKIEKENDSFVRYIIADAKFSSTKTVKNRYAVEVIYKYLFSISPICSNSCISGLFIFNGFLDENQKQDGICPIRDFDLENTIQPRAEIVSLTENENESERLHNLILKHTIGGESYFDFINTCTELNRKVNESKEVALEKAEMVENVKPLEIKEKTKSSHQKEKNGKLSRINTSIKLSDLLPNKKDVERFKTMGYTAIEELLPQHSKQEFDECKLFDRALKRELERKLKQKKYFRQ